jgi:hypothetical protein
VKVERCGPSITAVLSEDGNIMICTVFDLAVVRDWLELMLLICETYHSSDILFSSCVDDDCRAWCMVNAPSCTKLDLRSRSRRDNIIQIRSDRALSKLRRLSDSKGCDGCDENLEKEKPHVTQFVETCRIRSTLLLARPKVIFNCSSTLPLKHPYRHTVVEKQGV